MPRRGFIPKREVLADPIYNSVVVTKLINQLMMDGKRGVAQKAVYDAFDSIREKTGREPGEVFEQAMNNLDPGQISEPVVSRFGVHLIRVDGRREQVLSSSEQRQLARNVLREKKAEEAFETWAREVRGRAYVEMREPPR